MKTQRSRRRSIVTPLIMLVVGLLLVTLWLNRWRLGHSAVIIADPLVRAWAAEQVRNSSDSAYHLAASSIKVDEANRRLSIDSITLTTDSVVNSHLARPLAAITVRFRHCGITGIDLTRLAGRRGLHALHAGCDTVALSVRTLVAPDSAMTRAAADADSNNFLRFQGKIDLPSVLPFVAIDSIAFPHVEVSFDLIASDGRRTTLSVDSVAVALDSVRIDPREKVAKRRPLFSRNIRVKLDRFAGKTKFGDRVALDRLDLNLEDGTGRLDAVQYERQAGERIDSTGVVLLRAQHIALNNVRWRTFLLTGDIAIGDLQVDSAVIRMVAPRNPPKYVAQAVAGNIASALRSAGRGIAIDSLGIHSVRALQLGRRSSDSAVTTIHEITLAGLNVAVGDLAWRQPFPIGRVVLTANGLYRHTPGMDYSFARMTLDAGAQQMVLDSFRMAPQGGDSAFERRIKYQEVRFSMAMPHVEASGIDLPAFLVRGAMRARHLDVRGFAIDILADNHKPEDPGPPTVRRTPQRVLGDANTEMQVDTLTATGQVTYRNRDEHADSAGTLSFKAVQLHGYNFSTDPRTMSEQTPFRLIGDTKLMGVGVMHIEWAVPLLSPDFAMNWSGTLGTMDPAAMNPFLVNAVGMRFVAGVFEGVHWNAVVRNGQSSGTLVPRWKGMKVELPGVARGKTGLFGGMMRGFAKIAANAFGIRGDNDASSGHDPLDGKITHKWSKTETLPEFVWISLRDPLLAILKK